MNNTLEYIEENFEHLQRTNAASELKMIRENAFNSFKDMGIPTSRHEEWKYTRVGSLFNKDYNFPIEPLQISSEDLHSVRLPGDHDANKIIFVNGVYSASLSEIKSSGLVILPLETAAKTEYKDIVNKYLGDSGKYVKDGVNALNTAFVSGGIFIHIPKGKTAEHPFYFYNINDSRLLNVFSQPRSLIHVDENAFVQIIETYATLGLGESFTNQVMEMIVEKDAYLEYYKIQNDALHTNQVVTTHIRQVGKSHVHTVVISLDGGVIRNNFNVIMDAEHSEAHLYGLYFLEGNSHVDNHTLVDNVQPHCFSNQLYKGIINDTATGVFNGKIFVRQAAQKTNAYQSNKNILLSPTAIVNAKPQLEIFADDVKCSHGCTVGQLDDEGLFYLRSRGISENQARAMLVHAYAVDVLDHIKPAKIREYIDGLISESLDYVEE